MVDIKNTLICSPNSGTLLEQKTTLSDSATLVEMTSSQVKPENVSSSVKSDNISNLIGDDTDLGKNTMQHDSSDCSSTSKSEDDTPNSTISAEPVNPITNTMNDTDSFPNQLNHPELSLYEFSDDSKPLEVPSSNFEHGDNKDNEIERDQIFPQDSLLVQPDEKTDTEKIKGDDCNITSKIRSMDESTSGIDNTTLFAAEVNECSDENRNESEAAEIREAETASNDVENNSKESFKRHNLDSCQCGDENVSNEAIANVVNKVSDLVDKNGVETFSEDDDLTRSEVDENAKGPGMSDLDIGTDENSNGEVNIGKSTTEDKSQEVGMEPETLQETDVCNSNSITTNDSSRGNGHDIETDDSAVPISPTVTATSSKDKIEYLDAKAENQDTDSPEDGVIASIGTERANEASRIKEVLKHKVNEKKGDRTNVVKAASQILPDRSFRKIPASHIIQGCIRNVMISIRAQQRRANPTRYPDDSLAGETGLQSFCAELQEVYQDLSAVKSLRVWTHNHLSPTDTHVDSSDDESGSSYAGDDQEVDHTGGKGDHQSESEHDNDSDEGEDDVDSEGSDDCGHFLKVFCDGITRRDIGPCVTFSLLSALHKFILYEIFNPDPSDDTAQSHLPIDKGIQMIANALALCAFDEQSDGSHRKISSDFSINRDLIGDDTQHEAKLNFLVSSPESEKCVQKFLEVIVAIVGYSMQNDYLLYPSDISGLLLTCILLTQNSASDSAVLRSAALTAASQIILIVFQNKKHTGKDNNKNISMYRISILRKLIEVLQSSANSVSGITVKILGLLNTALECSRDQIPEQAERYFLQKILYNVILSTAMHARDCMTLDATVRVFFNLWVCMRLDLKCEFEIFIQSVHFRILDSKPKDTQAAGRRRKVTASETNVLGMAEAREIILESLLDICQVDANTLREIYFNYDCDIACSNLFENMMIALGKAVSLENWFDIATAVSSENSAIRRKANFQSKDTQADQTAASAAEAVSRKSGVPSGSSAQSNESTITVVGLNRQLQNSNSGLSNSSSHSGNTLRKNETPSNVIKLCLESILSALYSMSYPAMYEAPGTPTTRKDATNYKIIEVSKLGQSTSTSADLLSIRKRRKSCLCKIAEIFNENPDADEWLRYASSVGLIPGNIAPTGPEAAKFAAEILYNSQDVDKTNLGSYLSKGPESKYPFELMVRKEFAALHDFSNMSFPVALRSFLFKFRMPGEAQCIDRIMEVFSREFYEQQGKSSVFKNSDAVYVLSFSTIMLNTDLHNRTIKAGERMTKEQFVRNNRGINAGEDLKEEFLQDLYDQIKEREIQVKRDTGESKRTADHEDFLTILEVLQSKKRETSSSILLYDEQGKSTGSRIYDKEMFFSFAKPAINTLTGIFVRSQDDSTVVTALRALQHIVKVAASFHIYSIVNDVVRILLVQGHEYITKCLTQNYATIDDGVSVAVSSNRAHPAESNELESVSTEMDQPLPDGLLCSASSNKSGELRGSAAHRGLLALDSGFVLFRKHSRQMTEAWPVFIECLCALRDARALPEGLSELDDFADSTGKVLPLSSYAMASKKALDDYYRSLSDKDANKNKGWFRSLFRAGKGNEMEGAAIDSNFSNSGELSASAKALLKVVETAGVEDAVQLGSMKLPDATITDLLSSVSDYPFVDDPVGEHQAVFSLELAVRALLSDREHAIAIFPHFLKAFEGLLCQNTGDKIPSPFLVERVVVAILRCSIHLYEISDLRPHLRSSLQLITMTLPKTFIRVIADRIACGMAIILRVSFHFFETPNEWNFMGDTLDMLANFSISREFVFDGIASTVEYAIPSSKEDVDDRPKIPIDACESISRLLIRFSLGYYKGDLSLTVPAMLCLEKVYRYKSDQMQNAAAVSATNNIDVVDPISIVIDKEFWQNVAVAVYAVCRSSDPESSRHGIECFRRVILRVAVDQVPVDKWVAILYLMVNKQPPLAAEASRGNTFSLLGQTLSHVLPNISHREELKDDVSDIINQFAGLMRENLQHGKLGTVSPRFENTLQTATYIANHMISDEWQGEKEFSSWASETILSELERAGESIEDYKKSKDAMPEKSNDSIAEDYNGDESEVSELSATDGNEDDNVDR